jgi:hypothetical protein
MLKTTLATKHLGQKRFSPKYLAHVNMNNPKWRIIRALTFALSLGRDCICPLLPARQADHLHYRHLGRELPWIDVVPLHPFTHRIVTSLREAGLTKVVNPILRLAYGMWLVMWLYFVLLIAQSQHYLHGIPTPLGIMRTIMALVLHVHF